MTRVLKKEAATEVSSSTWAIRFPPGGDLVIAPVTLMRLHPHPVSPSSYSSLTSPPSCPIIFINLLPLKPSWNYNNQQNVFHAWLQYYYFERFQITLKHFSNFWKFQKQTLNSCLQMSPMPAVTDNSEASWEGCTWITSCHQFLNSQQADYRELLLPPNSFSHLTAGDTVDETADGEIRGRCRRRRGRISANTLPHCFFLWQIWIQILKGVSNVMASPIYSVDWNCSSCCSNCNGMNTKEAKSRAGASQVVQHNVANLPFIINSARQKNAHTSFSADWVDASCTV